MDAPSTPFRKSKPFKKSSLRQSIAFDDPSPSDTASITDGDSKPAVREVDFGPSVVRPAANAKRKPKSASRLSFGPGEIVSGDAAEALDEELFQPKKTIPRRNIELGANRLSLAARYGDDEGEVERPTYSKDYLNELKESTPTTPKELQEAAPPEDEGLDTSELEGAMIVDTEESRPSNGVAYIPGATEIAEKKEQRARLAQEQDFISLEPGPNGRYAGGSMVSLLPQRKKESRLVRDDEDVMEGFDEMVQDEPIALGRKAEREAKKIQRQMISQAIQEAEGSSDENSDDSEAERKADYEAAQTRAGMDGLKKVSGTTAIIPPKISPIPSLAECLGRLQSTLEGMEKELTKSKWELAQLEKEKIETEEREKEVQRLLKKAGDRYSSLRLGAGTEMPEVDVGDVKSFVGSATAKGLLNNNLSDETKGRGLESIGTTLRDEKVEDVI